MISERSRNAMRELRHRRLRRDLSGTAERPRLAVFRSLKGELGLRPIFHSKEERADGHLFISVLAYQFVQAIRQRLRAQRIHDSWSVLRAVLSLQRRVTASFVQRDGRTLHVRKATRPEPDLLRLYDALGLAHQPGGIQKLII